MTYLVTGATGFVGHALCGFLTERGHDVRAAVRKPAGLEASWASRPRSADQPADHKGTAPGVLREVVVGDMSTDAYWGAATDGCDAVFHLAARVHVMDETAADPLVEFRKVNTSGTEKLAQSAAESGVKRFVYASSVKVNGEWTTTQPFSEVDVPQPIDPYGVSKWEAEQALHRIASVSNLEVAIVRPTLIYGPGVGANFLALMKFVASGKPLPFGAVHNRRSFTSLANFCDFLYVCATHPQAAGETFMVSDGVDVSTAALVKKMAEVLKKPANLLPIPAGMINFFGTVLGKKEFARRLTGSLQVDITKARHLLDWSPPQKMEDALVETVEWFRDTEAW